MKNGPMIQALLTAYVPQDGNSMMYTVQTLSGVPDWVMNKHYDLEVRIAESDLPAWRDPASQTLLLQSMLRQVLAERCRLAVHLASKDVPVYSMILAKGGPKFKESVPGQPHPNGMPLPGGGVLVPEDGGATMHFYGAPIAAVAVVLSNVSGRPVQDKTGLTGRYDVAVHRPSMGATSAQTDAAGQADSGPTVFSFVESLGLKLVPAHGSVETLVVDHIDRPSQN